MQLITKAISRRAKNYKKAKVLYKEAFPKEERMPFLMMWVLSKMPGSELLAFHDGDVFCGLTYVAASDGIAFITYIAVEAHLRAKGYGSCMLKMIEDMYPHHKIILYMDRCDIPASDERAKRLRRRAFYLKNGFRDTGYLVDSIQEHQEILIKNGEFDQQPFVQFIKKYSNGAMKVTLTPKPEANACAKQ